jgi:CBS domain-containing protein
MRVKQLMSRHPRTCSPEDSLAAAARILWEQDVGVVPVISGARIVGMLTDRDICMAAYTQGRALHELRVSSAMSKELHTVRSDDSLDDAMRLMRERQVRRLPVVDDDGAVQGLLTISDLTLHAAFGDDVAAQDVVETLASITQPRGGAAAPASSEPAPDLVGAGV